MVKGIPKWVVLRGGMAGKWWEGIAGFLGELGGSIGREIEAWKGLGLLEKEGEVLLNFQREKKKVLLENSLDFSSLSLGASKSDEGGLKGWLISEDGGCWARWRFEFHRRHCSRNDGRRQGDWHSMPPGNGAERREERRAL